ncbi:casein kinase 2 regulatory subunit [Nowakowskiella sp. JEL0078]|nr:casein kinase 2 regulatory subunit [Nowakowskiella sp. JEL0078]
MTSVDVHYPQTAESIINNNLYLNNLLNLNKNSLVPKNPKLFEQNHDFSKTIDKNLKKILAANQKSPNENNNIIRLNNFHRSVSLASPSPKQCPQNSHPSTGGGGGTGSWKNFIRNDRQNNLGNHFQEDDFQVDRNFDDDSEDGTSESFTTNSSQTSEESFMPWISVFCARPGKFIIDKLTLFNREVFTENQFFIQVPEDFIEDDFNLTGLAQLVPFYNESLDLILDLEPEFDNPDMYDQEELIDQSAERLYGLIHQRFIVTKIGLMMMAEKYESLDFGSCPRELCNEQGLVPCGLSDTIGISSVKMYCPRCLDLYHPRKARFQNIDGAYFGTTFPHILFLTMPQLLPVLKFTHPSSKSEQIIRSKAVSLSSSDDSQTSDENITEDEAGNQSDEEDGEAQEYDIYVPKIFGFRINMRSKSGPRMQWLRWKEGMDKNSLFGPEFKNSRNEGSSEIPNSSE